MFIFTVRRTEVIRMQINFLFSFNHDDSYMEELKPMNHINRKSSRAVSVSSKNSNYAMAWPIDFRI